MIFKFFQEKQPKETIIEMSNLNDTNSNNSHNSNKQNTPISLEHIGTNLDNIDLNEPKVESELINEELTYDIPKFKMIEYLKIKISIFKTNKLFTNIIMKV